MRVFYAVVLAALLGVVAGMTTAKVRLSLTPWPGNPVDCATHQGAANPHHKIPPAPKVVVDHLEHNFGKMDAAAQGSHDFVFTNEGRANLVLEAGRTSCKCTGIEIERGNTPPGESTIVTLKWRADEAIGPYQETAIVHTNDPERRQVTLTISGRVTQVAGAVPPKLIFYHVSANRSTTGEIPLYCYLDEPLEILDFKLSSRRTADRFEVEFEPLTAEQLEEEEGAQSGYLVKVAIKPGLPLGTFEQRILIETNLDSAPEVVIPVVGKVSGDISVVGQGWDEENCLLNLGTVSSATGARRRLTLYTRGPYRKQVDFKITKVFPEELLRLKLGKTIELNKKATQTPLFIEIPKGSRPASHLSSGPGKLGRILIETGHPQISELDIRVRFAVRGQEDAALP